MRSATTKCIRFLSTPSGWRATDKDHHSHRGGSISIHALRVEGDRYRDSRFRHGYNFYPRPPGGGRHRSARAWAKKVTISIHALRVEGDPRLLFYSSPPSNFYPRPPGGGRLYQKQIKQTAIGFLSTPSGWRATSLRDLFTDQQRISIHALRVEGDRAPLRDCFNGVDFYPRPPGGGRPGSTP